MVKTAEHVWSTLQSWARRSRDLLLWGFVSTPRLTCGNVGPALRGRAGIFGSGLSSSLICLRMILTRLGSPSFDVVRGRALAFALSFRPVPGWASIVRKRTVHGSSAPFGSVRQMVTRCTLRGDVFVALDLVVHDPLTQQQF